MGRFLLILVAAASLRAGDSPLERATLRGVAAVDVVIDPVDPQVAKEGVTKEKLRAWLEERLRAAGIAVDASRSEFMALRLTAVRAPRGPFAVALTIALYQPVRLPRDPNVRTATATWDVETVLLADQKLLYQACQDSVDELAARFVAAYRSVNSDAAK